MFVLELRFPLSVINYINILHNVDFKKISFGFYPIILVSLFLIITPFKFIQVVNYIKFINLLYFYFKIILFLSLYLVNCFLNILKNS